ncbi:alpha/beta hydrolase family protein [Deinococcus sp. Marseille-Q6407]|uniref:alpha/beta hydrolase family protein n=1 Tax=Deinococcus sp. Marseille-Q6407 TaxID=2969223 RepID=UPI0021C20F84|nr:alpha/beta hydrolase [Deinococcus sp. Marseille-Q6407]
MPKMTYWMALTLALWPASALAGGGSSAPVAASGTMVSAASIPALPLRRAEPAGTVSAPRSPAPQPSAPQAPAVQTENTTLALGDFQSPAQWTYPAQPQASGRVPAVLLIHGSSPADMDFTYTGPQGQVVSSIFKDISQALGQSGIASLRYNKRYVSGPGQVDYARFYGQADLNTFLADAQTALDTMRHNPCIDPKQIYVYGWSEGSTVAAELVRRNPDVAGLIVQGPVALDWPELFEAQLTDVQLPYLRQVAPGGLSAENLAAVLAAPGAGLVARNAVGFALDPSSFTGGAPKLNPAADRDGNGVIDLDSEYLTGARQSLATQLNSPAGFLNIYSPARALPSVTAQAPQLKVPVLVLQGTNDANTPAAYLPRLTEALDAARVDSTVRLYPGLGHSLGPATSLVADDFAPIAQEPLRDLVKWLREKSSQK